MLLYVVNWADKATLGLVAQPLAEELGLTTAQIGLVGSAFFLASIVGSFFAGLLQKLMTLRWILVLLSVAWAVAMLPVVVAATFGVLVVSRMVLGLTEGPAYALIMTGAFSWHPEEKRGLPSACIASAASIAKIAIAPVLTLVVVTWGWRAAFLVLAAAGVAWCLVWLPTWQEGPYGKAAVSAAGADGADAGAPAVSWWRIFGAPSFVGGLLAVFAMYGLLSVVLTWLPSYFEVGLGFSRAMAGTMFAVPSVAGIVAMFSMTSISDRLMARGASSKVLRGLLPALALLICGLSLAALPYIGVPWLAALTVSLGYGVGSAVFPQFTAAISEIVPARQLAGTLGVFVALMSSGGLVGPYLTGRIVDQAVSPAVGYASAFQFFGIVGAVGALIALLTINPERDRARLAA